MTRKNSIKLVLIGGLISLALGGWLLHLKIHPPLLEGYNLIPFTAGLAAVFIMPFMFWFRSTLAYAYVINGFLVILGTITMAHFSIAHFQGPVTLDTVLFETLLPDILMLWGNFAIGKALFELELFNSPTDLVPKGRYFRYPNNGWWLVHLLAWSLVYILGNILWR